MVMNQPGNRKDGCLSLILSLSLLNVPGWSSLLCRVEEAFEFLILLPMLPDF